MAVENIDLFICGPEGGGVHSWTCTSQLANGYIQSNLADTICHMWHHVSQNLRWTVEKHGIDIK